MTALTELTIATRAAEHAALVALLEAAGALAHSSVDAADAAVLEPPPGTTPLWPTVTLTAWFPATLDLTPLCALLTARGLALSGPRPASERDWVRDTQQVPARAYGGELWVAPPGAPDVPAGAAVVWLTPGLGFGTGSHATTALCLEWLAAHPPRGARVLDYGCGSGILALAAARLGARSVWAVDNDPQARRASADNAAANGLAGVVRVGTPGQARGGFDVVVANIILPVLLALAPRLRARLRAGGRLLLSGVLDSQVDTLHAAFAPWLEELRVHRRAGWAALAGALPGKRRDE